MRTRPNPVVHDKPIVMDPAIAPEDYNLVLKQVRPRSVALIELHHRLIESGSGMAIPSVEVAPPEIKEIRTDGDRQTVVILVAGTCHLRSGDGTDVAETSFVYRVTVSSDIVAPENFWRVFAVRNTGLYVNPMLRQLLVDLASRSCVMAEPIGTVAVLPLMPPPQAVAPPKRPPRRSARAEKGPEPD